jgi:hypothetical protein
MNDLNSVQLTGTISTPGPTMTTTAAGDREAHFTLMRDTFSIGVVTSNRHGLWIASTMSAGDTVHVDGQLRQADGVLFIQAEQIAMVRKQAAHGSEPV